MKKLAVTDHSACMTCLTCEVVCAEAYYKHYGGESLSALRVETKGGKPKVVVCVQCGLCAKACDAGAIAQNPKGVWTIDKAACVGCGKCLDACPFKVMVKAAGRDVPSKCVACGLCAKKCPVEILCIEEGE
ncbi:MAG: 4Fe-4S binding protein [Clostridiales Family XIII bacterium]|jgi:Fe-S-cluster-containing hydrogenase component 2|nr:4Fe-4S binding protein [Clostridiales Family XIII bacterium]